MGNTVATVRHLPEFADVVNQVQTSIDPSLR